MSHTPKEAASLWCPMVRIARTEPIQVVQADGTTKDSEVALSVVGGCNIDSLGHNRVPSSCRCIADQCAMWRWQVGVMMRPSTGELFMKDHAGVDMPAKGFCGLAGFPVMVQS